MPNIITCARNILETSTVFLNAGTENALYPLYRLYDRDIGKMFMPTTTTLSITIDQGVSPIYAIDRLIVPAGHNLTGATISWQYSAAGTAFTNVVAAWTQADNLLINKSAAASMSYRFYKITVTGAAAIPQIPELFLSPSYTWEHKPQWPCGPFNDVYNVERKVLAGGGVRYLRKGNPKKQRHYTLSHASEQQKNNVMEFDSIWYGSKPFWICDHNGIWLYGELTTDIDITEASHTAYQFRFDFLEVLPV
jgi:hypothetical protein